MPLPIFAVKQFINMSDPFNRSGLWNKSSKNQVSASNPADPYYKPYYNEQGRAVQEGEQVDNGEGYQNFMNLMQQRPDLLSNYMNDQGGTGQSQMPLSAAFEQPTTNYDQSYNQNYYNNPGFQNQGPGRTVLDTIRDMGGGLPDRNNLNVNEAFNWSNPNTPVNADLPPVNPALKEIPYTGLNQSLTNPITPNPVTPTPGQGNDSSQLWNLFKTILGQILQLQVKPAGGQNVNPVTPKPVTPTPNNSQTPKTFQDWINAGNTTTRPPAPDALSAWQRQWGTR